MSKIGSKDAHHSKKEFTFNVHRDMSDEEYEEVSDEEKLQIAQHFLLSSPPGQFDEVLADVKKLLPPSLISPEMLTGIARAYNTRHSTLVTVGDKVMPICKEAEIDATKYVDSVSKKMVKVDHTKWTGTVVEDKPLPPTAFDASLESKRTAILSAVETYVTKHFGGGRAACGVYSKEGKITVVISGDKVNLKNFWSGAWHSTWTLESGELSGVAKLKAHYFEEGNVQLQTTKEFPKVAIGGGDDEAIGKAVAEEIFKAEQALQMALGAMYINMSEETLKSMRRVMPFTRSKMEWNLQAHKMVKQLHSK
ncbi:hypothetical protein TrST_g4185 [Triparma strigata]|uniref:F-actin-capping protein subunit alpha n=1 Tax=Triparma strigata TaxID=1606541 RepID=A0A9W7E737_9STRA|nr:hypothetical protein TrST_g4185 [Triparma strigata]